jgi:hypothetical protein
MDSTTLICDVLLPGWRGGFLNWRLGKQPRHGPQCFPWGLGKHHGSGFLDGSKPGFVRAFPFSNKLIVRSLELFLPCKPHGRNRCLPLFSLLLHGNFLSGLLGLGFLFLDLQVNLLLGLRLTGRFFLSPLLLGLHGHQLLGLLGRSTLSNFQPGGVEPTKFCGIDTLQPGWNKDSVCHKLFSGPLVWSLNSTSKQL